MDILWKTDKRKVIVDRKSEEILFNVCHKRCREHNKLKKVLQAAEMKMELFDLHETKKLKRQVTLNAL